MTTSRQIWRRLLACGHGLFGRLLLRAGARDLARHHFERVLSLRGDDFAAYVHLGRLAFAAGDYAGCRREFEHARRTDPERFARLRHPFELFEPRAAGTPFDEAGERATWRSMRPGAPGTIRRSPVHSVDVPVEPADGDAPVVDGRPAGDADREAAVRGDSARTDDCCSDAERGRFARLGPIRSQDLAGVDVDEVCRKLTGA